MSFLKCCVGADPRPPPEAIRPVAASHRRSGGAAAAGRYPSDGLGGSKKKTKMPTEVFFDPSKPDGQLSSVTDPPNSMRDFAEAKKRKDGKERGKLFPRFLLFVVQDTPPFSYEALTCFFVQFLRAVQ